MTREEVARELAELKEKMPWGSHAQGQYRLISELLGAVQAAQERSLADDLVGQATRLALEYIGAGASPEERRELVGVLLRYHSPDPDVRGGGEGEGKEEGEDN